MKILHLEDDMMLSHIFQTAINERDKSVDVVHHVQGAGVIEHVKEQSEGIQVYILDIRLPGSLSGIDVAHKLRSLALKTPIILSSAYDKPDQSLLDSLNCLWVAKPWQLGVFTKDIVDLVNIQSVNPKADKKHETLKVVSLSEILKACVKEIKPYSDKRSIHIHEIGEHSSRLKTLGKPDSLYSAFHHIIFNAVKYGQLHGNVIIQTRQQDMILHVRIEDDGIGIAPEFHEQIFERFFQVDDEPEITTPYRGMGIGLYVAKRVIAQHDGYIRVDSALGRGSVFDIYLPSLERIRQSTEF